MPWLTLLLSKWRTVLPIAGVSVMAALLFFSQRSLSYWKERAESEKVARLVTIANYREASKRAQEAAEAKKRAIEAEHKRIAEHADENYASLRAQYRALLLQRTAKANSRSANGTGLSERPGAAILPENSASPAGFYISRTDGLRTADLGAYATACFRWAEDVAKNSTPPR